MVSKIEIAEEVLYSQLTRGIPIGELIDDYQDPAGRGELTEEEKEIIKIRIERRITYEKGLHSHEVEDPAVIHDPEGHLEWYDEWKKKYPDGFYWKNHLEYISEKFKQKYQENQEKAGRIIQSLDSSSDIILHLIENPQRKNFNTKGLVIGYVQSGKTANFTAVIAKAADSGYRLIIVLTGIHNNLRTQTQKRLDSELTGESDEGINRPDLEYQRWKRLTNDINDFDQMNINREKFHDYINCRNPIIGALKKHCGILDRFIQWAKSAPVESRAKIPLLLIDDEADLASINTKYNKKNIDEDPSQTNKRIRTILELFPRNCYIGYTATPFANVLIDMSLRHDEYGRDIYPRNFIVSLPKPEDYFGAGDIFAQELSDRYIRIIPNQEIKQIMRIGSKANPGELNSITPKMEKAILSFILSCSIRSFRGDADAPMTLLIHTGSTIYSHEKIFDLVQEYFEGIKYNWGDKFENPHLIKKFKEIWDEDFSDHLSSQYIKIEQFEILLPYFEKIFNSIKIYQLNYISDDELDYSKFPDIKVIAIGGNKLSRGLTLEGLSTSLFLRITGQYDTLLQMGRWFGYKENYDDLTRIFTSDLLATRFEELALVEEELREEIKIYEDENLTPVDVAIKIRAHKSMKVTAKNKMGRATMISESYNGKLSQTIWFPLENYSFLSNNIKVTSQFIRNTPGWKKIGGSYLVKNIASNNILKYLNKYNFAQKDDIQGVTGLNSPTLLDYIKRSNEKGELQSWNVAIVGLEQSKSNAPSIKWENLEINPVFRSRLKKYNGPGYSIGALSDPEDLIIDIPGRTREDDPHARKNPLLLIYRIDKNSKPEKSRKLGKELRTALFESIDKKIDVIGLVFVFPKSGSEKHDYIGQVIGES